MDKIKTSLEKFKSELRTFLGFTEQVNKYVEIPENSLYFQNHPQLH